VGLVVLLGLALFCCFRAGPPAAAQEGAGDEHPFENRFQAPSLDGGVEWINTAGPIDLRQLRGKFVLLDFWTYCCINCMHILPELKKLEQAYPNEIVVIGVHSAKFATEQDSKNIAEAIERYEIEHPVVNDAQHFLWNKYGVQSWPTLCVIDPEGNLVVRQGGEIDFATLDAFFKKVMPYYKRKKLLKPSPPPPTGELAGKSVPETPLRFPGKLLADEKTGRLFIADSNHNRIVLARLDGTLVDTIGSGQIGRADGDYAKATFDHPQGMTLDGETLYVADTENHLIRKVDLKKKIVSTIAGTGRQGHGWPGIEQLQAGIAKTRFTGPPLKTALNSPWALWVNKRDLFIAMAGPHQIWKMTLPKGEIGPFAGNGREDIVDGPHLPAAPYELGSSSFAQPSGLASDGKVLYVADSEGSSIRAVPFDAAANVQTVVGTAWMPLGARLFEFGDVDGQGQSVRLQHPLDVLHHDGLLYVSDTYNNKIKVVDPRQATSKTLSGTGEPGADDAPAQFDEPAGLAYAGGKLYVADTNNHAIRTIELAHPEKVATLTIQGLEPPAPEKTNDKPRFPDAEQVAVPAAKVKPADGTLTLEVALTLPEGYKINPVAPLRYLVEAKSDAGPIDRKALGTLARVEKPAPKFAIELPASGAPGSDTLTISLAYYYCQDGSEGVCKAGNVIWTLPLSVAPDATASSVALPYTVQ
jgi:thiol-disulfide isomerase/thioredoxin